MSSSEKTRGSAPDDKIEFDEQLIKAIKSRPVLYERNRSKDTINKVAAWAEVATETGKPERDCKLRWRSLRDRYVREKRTNVYSDDGDKLPGSKEKSALMEQLGFLSSCISHRKEIGTHNSNTSSKSKNGPSPLSLLEAAIRNEADSDDQSSIDDYESLVAIDESAKRPRPESSPSPLCLVNGDSTSKKPRLNGHATHREDHATTLDEDELFCRSLVGPLKRLPHYKRALAKIRMLQNLYELEFQQPVPP